jgi:hypothetical protein
MTMTSFVDVPDELAARAAAVPGLPDRLLGYLRFEVSQHERLQSPHRSQAKEIVRRALLKAEEMKANGFDRDEAMSRFQDTYREIMQQIARE